MLTKNKHGHVDTFKYKDLPAIQMYGVMDEFTKLGEYSKNNPFKVIIELGTDYGGLTNAIADNVVSNDALIYTFDINKDRFINYWPEKIIFNCMDIYSNFEYVIKLIKTKRVLVLCDGGNKELEFNTLQSHMKPGDVIMAHDYFANKNEFEKSKQSGGWAWWEFGDSSYNINESEWFEPIKTFKDYVWFIREKL